MEGHIKTCADILQFISDNFGKDNPAMRHDACVKIAGSLKTYQEVIRYLTEKSLLDYVLVPDPLTRDSRYYPVMSQKTHRLVEKRGAMALLSECPKRLW